MTGGNSTIKNSIFNKNVAGVLNRGTCLIDNCRFTNSFAGYCGGALSNRGVLVEITVISKITMQLFMQEYYYPLKDQNPSGSITLLWNTMVQECFQQFLTIIPQMLLLQMSLYKNYCKGNKKQKKQDIFQIQITAQ